jgi:hypothetical protein
LPLLELCPPCVKVLLLTIFRPEFDKNLELEFPDELELDEELLVVKFGIVLNIMHIIDIVIKT